MWVQTEERGEFPVSVSFDDRTDWLLAMKDQLSEVSFALHQRLHFLHIERSKEIPIILAVEAPASFKNGVDARE